ncbi:tRNA (adenosine(37)-N6)-threonylcarbamoyltransferase complex ATPase subunit type 1 TsaE [Alphaproteobacteria bacterium endosymbiont of Tiliacea citrago]|uniref:tRNA (adenosine(37)-N6)-threonylcarbamoyltransferase complex ATPase subunit type 1 TsaE n=1 Tax=Alphaproteobacteria bacterium endosymbiont of Tiliacea citrago TaxID=3077944 RepID=UPI00313E2E02
MKIILKNFLTLQNISNLAKEIRVFFKIGSIILINGPMGVGKTTLLREVLKEYKVSSPSFLHALTYGEFLHIDAYTLTKEQFLLLNIEEELESKCIIIEWGNLVENIVKNFLATKIKLNIDYHNEKREIVLMIDEGR